MDDKDEFNEEELASMLFDNDDEDDDNENSFNIRDQLYKIGLPGKLIISKRKGLLEVLFS